MTPMYLHYMYIIVMQKVNLVSDRNGTAPYCKVMAQGDAEDKKVKPVPRSRQVDVAGVHLRNKSKRRPMK